MFRQPFIAIATFVVVVAASVTPTLAPTAIAEPPKCRNKAGKYVACPDALRARAAYENAKGGHVEYEWKVEGGEEGQRRPKRLKSGK